MRAALLLPLGVASAFPFMANDPNLANKHLLERQQSGGILPGGPETCPFNPDHQPGHSFSLKFPYNWANNGLPGKGKGGYQVPAPGDDAHRFIPPTDKDIRGPCPGLNALANHGFIARDGVTNLHELVDAAQNVFNMGWDLAVFISAFTIYLADGDPITTKLSIGCDATTRTSWNPSITGSEPGLDGHNKFESDASLTRNDYFTANGDNFSLNTTLFKMFAETTGGLFDFDGVADWKYLSYVRSRTENPDFFFGPIAIFHHGAASFIYELFPNGNDGYVPTLENTATWYGAKKNRDGSYESVPERIPDNWVNREDPYSILEIAGQILKMYAKHPVGFGGNVNGNFVGLDFSPYIKGGEVSLTKPEDVACFLYQLLTARVPSSLNGILTPAVEAVEGILTLLGGTQWKNLGCPAPLTKRDE
ncbi:Cloroperoxidase [Delitschia confertaspora ATCC 74209]|uniref:Cloroperoxidase n=1 Tax=Delitschia confertaspora ATCC 74209 TaxID=1513339 RepID=A0A9P4MV74_9PLEO|nr:Cloroperoxidase [Delitschia confertaspora ATCC 74209]